MHTVYVARALGQTSDPIAVNVRPRLSLKRAAHHVFRLRITAGSSFVGKYGVAQVWDLATVSGSVSPAFGSPDACSEPCRR